MFIAEKNGYYIENLQLKKYFCKYRNINFKTKEEYYAYLNEHNIPTEKINYIRKSAYSIEVDPVPLQKWVEFDVAIGTYLYDNRDYSMYQFNNEEEIEEFFQYLKIQPDRFLQQCFYEGYEGDEVDTIEHVANEWIATYENTDYVFDPEKANTVFAHFVISYLPDDEEVRAKRKEAFIKVLANMKEITPNTFIYINAQNYREEDYLDDPQIMYLFRHESGVGPMRARNECLEWFYNSGYEYMILSDDDAFLAPTRSAKDFYQEIQDNVERFTKVPMDICYARNMQYRPFNRADAERAEIRGKMWELNFLTHHWLCWVLIRNFKKAYNDEQYMDETVEPWKNKGYDDTDFSFQMTAAGYRSWQNPLLQLLPYNAGEGNSAIYNKVTNPMYRIYNMDITRTKWLGEPNSKGVYDYASFREKLGQKKRVMLNRAVPIDNVRDEMKGRRVEEFVDKILGKKPEVIDKE